MKIFHISNVGPDPELPQSYWQVSYSIATMGQDGMVEMTGCMSFRASSLEDAKAKFVRYTDGDANEYHWP